MTVYASMSFPAKWVTVLRLGAGKIFSDSLEYFQAMTLGANNYLRADIYLPQTIALDDYKAVPLMEKAVTDYLATPAWTAVKNWVASHFNGT